MNHLLIFDISNTQADYSAVMEGIALLESGKISQFSNHRRAYLRGKYFRSSLDSMTTSPRYLECPLAVPLRSGKSCVTQPIEEVWVRYYETLYHNRKELSQDSLTSLNQLYIQDGTRTLQVKTPSVIRGHLEQPENISPKTFQDDLHHGHAFYAIRVRVRRTAPCDLQYLALLLKHFPYLVGEKRIFVLLLDQENAFPFFPFCNPHDQTKKDRLNEAHGFFSQYLRLLAKENTGVIYAPLYEPSEHGIPAQPIIAPMDFTNAAAGDAFFPLVEIGKDEYNTLFNVDGPILATSPLATKIRKGDLLPQGPVKHNERPLFHIGSGRFRNAGDADPRVALPAYIAETAWCRLRRNWQNETGELDAAAFAPVARAIDHIFTVETNHWLCFALFSFLLCSENGEAPTPSDVQSTYRLARELSNGLQQLIQNAIQHTENASCIFTFYLDSAEEQLHLYVSDLNMRDTIVENFRGRLQSEFAICQTQQSATAKSDGEQCFDLTALTASYRELIGIENLALRHFFNVFAPQDTDGTRVRQAWKDFRASDSTAHIGLLVFFQTLIRAHADLRVQSTTSYSASASCGNLFISKADDREVSPTGLHTLDRTREYSTKDERTVPGTHYQIQVPITRRRLTAPTGGASLSDIGRFTEDYRTFAKYVDYAPKFLSPETAEILAATHSYDITLADDKFRLQLLWTTYWHRLLTSLDTSTEKTVFVWQIQDLVADYLSVGDNAEAFLKGMFAALSQGFQTDRPVYLAITNLDSTFFNCLKNVCISLSNRSFAPQCQLFFADTGCQRFVQLFGASLYEAVGNAVTLTIEHGSDLFDVSDMASARHIASLAEPPLSRELVQVMPFDSVIPVAPDTSETLFDRYIFQLAQCSLERSGSSGYKLEHTHVRLGNKVHIGSFYEMSFLFYRTTIANRTAFQILRSFSSFFRSKLDQASLRLEPILFYSYASYSKAILTSVVEISRAYAEELVQIKARQLPSAMSKSRIMEAAQMARRQIGFASYQHNLQSESTSDSVQLYFGIPEQYEGGSLLDSKRCRLKLDRDVYVAQIVPISSTLSTFDKMFAKLKNSISEETSKGTLRLSANYTTMWVYDNTDYAQRLDGDTLRPSKIEAPYWTSAQIKEHLIHLDCSTLRQLKECPWVIYSTQGSALWEDPLRCRQCFPDEDKLILEVPLVETDLTSTVPAMQIRQELDAAHSQLQPKKTEYITANNQRLQWLNGCVYYGHIKRGKNHHQYYINTQDFFYKDEVQRAIEIWLKRLAPTPTLSKTKLKIIFSPEHNTNVGFAQYVNTFYFGGSAEIISVNEDKIYRSNFVCEHEMLRSTIERAHLEADIFEDDQPVEFYFVDDTINTGATVQKANSLLHSLLPKEYAKQYPTFLFTKCFVLIDRMSDASKRTYVGSGSLEDFHSFLHVDISNMRVHGDSCVGCKLQKNAKKLFNRSASRSASNYWANKYRRLRPIDYDDLEAMSKLRQKPHAYARLVLSHIAQNYIFKDSITTREKGEYYDSLLFLFSTLLGGDQAPPKPFFYKELIAHLFSCTYEELRLNPDLGSDEPAVRRLLAELLLKLLSRPFFSFDYSFRLQLQSFLLILSECYLFHCVEQPNSSKRTWAHFTSRLQKAVPSNDPRKGFLLDNHRLERTVQVAQSFLAVHEDDSMKLAIFFKDVLFEALADIRSTYLLRRSVLQRVNTFVQTNLSQITCNQADAHSGQPDPSRYGSDRMDVCFWVTYLAHIQREIDCTSDEIKTIWLKYLILSGQELKHEEAVPDTNFIAADNRDGLGIQTVVTDSFPVAEELFLTTSGVEFDRFKKDQAETSIDKDFPRYRTLTETWCRWLGRTSKASDTMLKWIALLSNSSHLSQTEQWYQDFLSTLRGFLAALNYNDNPNDRCLKQDDLTVALLTMSRNTKKASIENLHVVHAIFGNQSMGSHDESQGKYIIKDRVMRAFNNDSGNEKIVGALRKNGYSIVFSDPVSEKEYVDQQGRILFDRQHHVTGNHRKPYLVLLFDNPDLEGEDSTALDGLGRKLIPLNYVFLYISIYTPEENKRAILPRILMRDILTYRNRIMRLLEEDFNGDLMEKNAEFLQEKIILTRERSARHASTTDDVGVLRVFGLSSVSGMKTLQYPVSLEPPNPILDEPGYRLPDETGQYQQVFPGYPYSADLWLLLQSYVNAQIARLFSRHFNEKDKELVKNEGIPALYLSRADEQAEDVFKQRAETFGDLGITPSAPSQDNRFVLLNKAVTFYFDVPLDSPMACHENEWYNAEYIRCILLDVVLSAIKHATVDDSLLSRVDTLVYEKKCGLEDRQSIAQELSCLFDPEDIPAPTASHIFMFRDGLCLIILNNVNHAVLHRDTTTINEEIFRRTHDVLDYGDGHMSLFTIRHFIRGLWGRCTDAPDSSFRYITKETLMKNYAGQKAVQGHSDTIQMYDTWFETRLPIFKEEIPDGQKTNLD